MAAGRAETLLMALLSIDLMLTKLYLFLFFRQNGRHDDHSVSYHFVDQILKASASAYHNGSV
jgi:hypothetical protein